MLGPSLTSWSPQPIGERPIVNNEAQRDERRTIRISGATSFRSMDGKVTSEEATCRVTWGSCPRPRWPCGFPAPPSGSLDPGSRVRAGGGATFAAKPGKRKHGRAAPGLRGCSPLGLRQLSHRRPGEDASQPLRSRCRPALGPWHLTFPARHKAFCRCRSDRWPAKTPLPFTFYSLSFPVHSWLILMSVR